VAYSRRRARLRFAIVILNGPIVEQLKQRGEQVMGDANTARRAGSSMIAALVCTITLITFNVTGAEAQIRVEKSRTTNGVNHTGGTPPYTSAWMTKEEETKADVGRGAAPAHGRITTDSIARLKDAFRRYTQVSGRDHTSFAMTLQVLDALSAPTKEEFHRRIANVPVTISVSPVIGEDGRTRLRKDYFLEGSLRASYFIDTVSAPIHQLAEGQLPTGPSDGAMSAGWPSQVNCYYTDPWGTIWTDECATQQEIDDGVAALIVLDYEATRIIDELAQITPDYCAVIGGYPSVLQYPEETDEPCYFLDPAAEMESARGPSVSGLWGNAAAPQSSFMLASNLCSDTPTSRRPCFMEGVQAGVASAFWIGSKYGAIAVLTSATPTTGAVGWAVFGAAASGFALAGAAASFIACVRS
jgi:hypothetical protein